MTLRFFCLLLMGFCSPGFAIGEKLIEQVMSSEFIFDSGESYAPFIRLGYLEFQRYQSTELTENCVQPMRCEFDQYALSQGLGLPVWVGKKNMLLLAETVNVNQFSLPETNTRLYSGGLLAAWLQQPRAHTQWGAFYFHKWSYEDGAEQNRWRSPGFTTGAVLRHQHAPGLHGYYGLILDTANGHRQWLPYLGFDWTINPQWSLYAVAPWPSLSYAPDESWLFTLGLSPSGSYWPTDETGLEPLSGRKHPFADYNRWDVTFRIERPWGEYSWLGFSVGKGLLGSLSVTSDDEVTRSLELSNSYFMQLSWSFRPRSAPVD